MYIVSLKDNDLVYLAWAAGLAQGAGNNDAAEALSGLLSRIQEITYDEPTEAEEMDQEEQLVLDGEYSEIDSGTEPVDSSREVDPQFNPDNVLRPRFGYETGVGPVPDNMS